MDLLDRHKDDIEEELYWHIGDLLNLDVDLIFYDTTSVYFEIDERGTGQEKRVQQRRQGRKPSDRCGPGGDPGRHSGENLGVPGNTAEVSTIERVKKDLRGWKLNRCIFVADAGMSSEDNLKILSGGGAGT